MRDLTVDHVINTQIPVTLALAALAILWAIPIGGLLGVAAAMNRGSRLDTLLTSVSTLLLVVPVFLFAEIASTYLIRRWHVIEPGWDSWETRLAASFVLALAPAGTSPASSGPASSTRSARTSSAPRARRGCAPDA